MVYPKKNNPIVEMSFAFSLEIMAYTEKLEKNGKYSMARQLFRSGTSIGANVAEAQHAESKLDFIHKIKISAKEAEETKYWLSLCKNASNYPDCSSRLDKIESINRMLGRIIISSKIKIKS